MPEAHPNQTRAETIEQPAVFRVSVAFRSQAKRQEQHANAYPPSSLLVGRCSIPVLRWHWSASSGCSAVASAIPPLGNRSDTSDPGRFYRERNARRWHSQSPRRHLPLQARRIGIGRVGVSPQEASTTCAAWLISRVF